MIFTIVLISLDIPMGYIADRFNRKLLNIIGDIGVAVTFVFYAFAQNVYMTLVAECMLGIFMAMTNGVDQCFLKFNANKITLLKVNFSATFTSPVFVLIVKSFIVFIFRYTRGKVPERNLHNC